MCKIVSFSFIYLVFIVLITAQDEVSSEEKDVNKLEVDFGGTLRYNYNYSSWKSLQKKRGGDLGFEVFRINVDLSYGNFEAHIDQRFYAASFGGAFLKYGWFQYNFSDERHLKFGLLPSYFGAKQFNSHSWFFQLPFYLGFEDDHDMGISYSINNSSYQLDLGFYKNAETLSFADNAPISDARYSYDISGRNKEINQFTARFNYKLGQSNKQLLGTTLQYGGIWNIDTESVGSQFGWGVHYDVAFGNFDIKLQHIYYNNAPNIILGQSTDFIEVTAYNAPYQIAAKAQIYSIGVAYTIPLKWDFLSSIQVYNDYSYMDKDISEWEDTQMNVLGLALSGGPLVIYIDYGLGKQHPWLGPQYTAALSTGDPKNGWQSRFNINVGIYY